MKVLGELDGWRQSSSQLGGKGIQWGEGFEQLLCGAETIRKRRQRCQQMPETLQYLYVRLLVLFEPVSRLPENVYGTVPDETQQSFGRRRRVGRR